MDLTKSHFVVAILVVITQVGVLNGEDLVSHRRDQVVPDYDCELPSFVSVVLFLEGRCSSNSTFSNP